MSRSRCGYCGMRCVGLACAAHRDLVRNDPFFTPEIRDRDLRLAEGLRRIDESELTRLARELGVLNA